ncbi:MAG: winged helix-turn-helix domain-containing protein, partial [Erysipelotrichaceae bacterium]
VHISLKRREVSIQGEILEMTKKEFDLLEYLGRNKGIVLSRDQILNDIWGFDYDGDTRIVDVHIFKLRAKLKKANVEIKSTRGIGYLLEEIK